MYQGDHLGVEFALGGHEGLLKAEGLLCEEDRLLGGSRPPTSSTWEGLVIDDFFAVSTQGRSERLEDSEAFKRLEMARMAYEKHQLEDSPEKDIIAEDLFKAAGGEDDPRREANERSLALVGSTLGKRVAMSSLSLRIAALGHVTPTLTSRLVGGWTSALLFRRCIASVVDSLFQLGTYVGEEAAQEVVRLGEDEKEELVLLSILAPIISSNVMVDYPERFFATDASLAKGAIVETRIGRDLCESLWHGGSKKGHYTVLDGPFRELLHHNNGEEPVGGEDFQEPRKDIPMVFDFKEMCGGVGAVSGAMASMGLCVAPVLDLSNSRKYNITSMRMLEWIFSMLQEGRFRGFLIAPPCTSFSLLLGAIDSQEDSAGSTPRS